MGKKKRSAPPPRKPEDPRDYYDLLCAVWSVETCAPRMREDWSPEMEYYVNYVRSGKGKTSDCIACRKCERVCPQHIQISDWMKKIRITLEDENYML